MGWLVAAAEWLYTNTAGNLVASFIAFCVAGAVHHVKVVRPLHRRLDAQDRKLAEMHADVKAGGQ
jgi:hypothetical protein